MATTNTECWQGSIYSHCSVFCFVDSAGSDPKGTGAALWPVDPRINVRALGGGHYGSFRRAFGVEACRVPNVGDNFPFRRQLRQPPLRCSALHHSRSLHAAPCPCNHEEPRLPDFPLRPGRSGVTREKLGHVVMYAELWLTLHRQTPLGLDGGPGKVLAATSCLFLTTKPKPCRGALQRGKGRFVVTVACRCLLILLVYMGNKGPVFGQHSTQSITRPFQIG
jgi:hypothetical protein